MLARGSIAIARVLQLLRQRIPLKLEGMRRAVVHPLNGALPVLGVDLLAVQLDGLHHAPCVGDDSDGVGFTALQQQFISSLSCLFSLVMLYQNGIFDMVTCKGAFLRNNCAVAKALIQSQRNIGVAFWSFP